MALSLTAARYFKKFEDRITDPLMLESLRAQDLRGASNRAKELQKTTPPFTADGGLNHDQRLAEARQQSAQIRDFLSGISGLRMHYRHLYVPRHNYGLGYKQPSRLDDEIRKPATADLS